MEQVVLEPRVSPEHTSKYVDTVIVFAKIWTKGHWPLDDLWPHIGWGLVCDSTQGSLCPSPMKIHQSMWILWPFFAKTWSKGHWPLGDLWSHICWGHMCDSTQGSLCPSPMKIHQSMWIQWLFLQKKLEPKVIDLWWPLTPHLLRPHVWLYPRIIVSKSHENTSKYVDTENLFAKTWTKGHWPLDDLWPHICWRHMCDSTQGSLCPSPMGIYQCMWIQWSIFAKNYHIHTHTYYIHTHTYTYYVQNQWSHSLFLNYVQARQKVHNPTFFILNLVFVSLKLGLMAMFVCKMLLHIW